MHILIIPSEHFFTEKYPLGGIFQLHQAIALANAGIKVGVLGSGIRPVRPFFRSYRNLPVEKQSGVRVLRRYSRQWIPLRYLSPDRTIAKYKLNGLAVFKEYIAKYGLPDCVHAHSVHFAGVIASAIKEEFGVPFVFTEHNSQFGRNLVESAYKRSYFFALEKASALTAVSSALAKLLEEYYREREYKFEVLYNLLDPHIPYRGSETENRAGKPFKFLHIGSLDDNKDQERLIYAFSQAFQNKGVVLKIGGHGPALSKLEALVKVLGIEDQVHFLGMLSRDQVFEELRACDCFVLSSKYETFGVVLIEALAMGVPVVATRCGGPEDIVDDGNGILVDPEDTHQLSAAMQKMTSDIESFSVQEIRDNTISKFGEEAFVERALFYYRKALSN